MADDMDERIGEIWGLGSTCNRPRPRLDSVRGGNGGVASSRHEQTAQRAETALTDIVMQESRPTTVRALQWDAREKSREILLNREWIVTNGLGGYASGTISGAITRRYHGLLIAALPAPHGRVVMWSHVSEFLRFGGNDTVSLGAEERAGGQLELKGAEYLREFQLEDGLPVWRYHVRDI